MLQVIISTWQKNEQNGLMILLVSNLYDTRSQMLGQCDLHGFIEFNGPLKIYGQRQERNALLHTAIGDLLIMKQLFTPPFEWNTILFLLQLLNSSV